MYKNYVEAIELNRTGHECDHCDHVFQVDDEILMDIDYMLCDSCEAEYLSEIIKEAEEYALDNVRLTRDDLPIYEPDKDFRPTPEEYERGDREAHTPRSVFAQARHYNTNYDALLRDKCGDKHALESHIFYNAIFERVSKVLMEAGFEAWMTIV